MTGGGRGGLLSLREEGGRWVVRRGLCGALPSSSLRMGVPASGWPGRNRSSVSNRQTRVLVPAGPLACQGALGG